MLGMIREARPYGDCRARGQTDSTLSLRSSSHPRECLRQDLDAIADLFR